MPEHIVHVIKSNQGVNNMAKVELSEYEKEQRKNNYHYFKNGKPKVGSIISGRVPRPTYGLDVGECLSSFLDKYKFSCPKNEEITIFDMIHTIQKKGGQSYVFNTQGRNSFRTSVA